MFEKAEHVIKKQKLKIIKKINKKKQEENLEEKTNSSV